MIDSKEKEKIYNIMKTLKKEGYTIIFITNNVSEILLADRIFILENKQVKYILKKEEIIENIKLLEECDIKVPELIEIILKLKENNINIKLEEWTITEMINEIVKVCKK